MGSCCSITVEPASPRNDPRKATNGAAITDVKQNSTPAVDNSPRRNSTQSNGGSNTGRPSYGGGGGRGGNTPKTPPSGGTGPPISSNIGRRISQVSSGVPGRSLRPVDSSLREFTYEELERATIDFKEDRKLGEGGFGTVFRGDMDIDGNGKLQKVAVKKLSPEGGQGEMEWMAEVYYLGQLRHPNLVRLIGYCAEDLQRLLVYEYVEFGSLERYLFHRHREPLGWDLRMKVALQAAKGLAYLHEQEPQIIYRDFKTSNILVDREFNAKLSDFGLAREGPVGNETHVSTRVVGTYGYAAPEYCLTGHLTAMSDVYTFGVVLLEIISGRRAMDQELPRAEQNIRDWANPFLADPRRTVQLVDKRLGQAYAPKAVVRVAKLAQACLKVEPRDRLPMSDVVKSLEVLQNLPHASVLAAQAAQLQQQHQLQQQLQRNIRN